jgi:hypothetical protein
MTQSQTTQSKSTQPQTIKVKPATETEVTSPVQLAELEKLVMDSSVDGQGGALGNPAISTPQRQYMARHIGQVQGNRHLQNIVMLSRNLHSTVIQRQPAGGGGGGLPAASSVQVQHARAVDALTKAYAGNISEKGSVEEKPLDAFNTWYDDQMKGKDNPETGKKWEPGDAAKRSETIYGVQAGGGLIVIPILPAKGGQDPNSDDNRISTIAHEILHANCKITGAVPLLIEECATEFLAAKACQAAGISPGIAKYSNAMPTFMEFAKQVGGTSVMQNAYFSGVGGIQTAFDAAKGAGAWQFFCDAMNAGKNADAKELLVEGTRGGLFIKKKAALYKIVNAIWITDEELAQFQQGWSELLIAEKEVCRSFFQRTIEDATIMRDSRKQGLQNAMAT